MSAANKTFYSFVNNAVETQFSEVWNNGTGYYDGAANGPAAPKLETGQMVRSVSPMPNNRKILIVGLGKERGNLVFFERYTGGAHDVIVSCGNKAQLPQPVRRAINSQITEESFTTFFKWLVEEMQESENA